MLAKVWKKVLLAICIIACIYNVMHKLVSRTSLEVQLQSVQEQTELTEPSDDEENKEKASDTNNNANQTNNDSKKDNNTIVVIY